MCKQRFHCFVWLLFFLVQDQIAKLVNEVRDSPYIYNEEGLIENWLKEYQESKFYEDDHFYNGLDNFLSIVKKSNVAANVIRSNTNEISACRFAFQSVDLKNATSDAELLDNLRSIANNHAEFNVTFFNTLFPHFDQLGSVKHNVAISCSIAGNNNFTFLTKHVTRRYH